MAGSKQRMFAAANKIIASNTGYDQAQRWSFYNMAKKVVIPNREADCSAFCGAVIDMGGYPIDLSGTFYTGNFKDRAVKAGFTAIPYSSLAALKPGDFVLSPSYHVEFVGADGRFGSAVIDERGRIAGGKAGNQTGMETRWRSPYVYSKGWQWVLRPPADVVKPAVKPAVEKEIGVKHYQRVDATGKRTLQPGRGFWLHVKAGMPTSNASNIVGGVGPYSITTHLYAKGEPGDEIVVYLMWQDVKANPVKNSVHYTERVVIPASGLVNSNVEFKRSVPLGYAVYAKAEAPKTNKAPVQITRFATDAYLFKAV